MSDLAHQGDHLAARLAGSHDDLESLLTAKLGVDPEPDPGTHLAMTPDGTRHLAIDPFQGHGNAQHYVSDPMEQALREAGVI